MTNVPFGGIEDFRDLESVNAYRELTERVCTARRKC